MPNYYAVVEAGGTKFRCAIIDENRSIIKQCRIPTSHPEETLQKVQAFFEGHKSSIGNYNALGIASFGPLDLNSESATYGHITKTPKKGWSDTPLVSVLSETLSCPVVFDTDVNAAALSEYRWGAGQKCDVVLYVTVGTGIGVGVVINGRPLHGLIHPEIGHMLLPGHKSISGTCPFHSNCAEGLASGTAMNNIWGQSAETLGNEHQAWDIESQILAQFCHNLLVCFSAQKIILGGGVLADNRLLPMIIEKTEQSLGGYLSMPHSICLTDIIVPTGLGEDSGILGAFALTQS